MDSKLKSHISVSAIKNQIVAIWPAILFGIFVSLSGAGITILVAYITHTPIWKLAKDPSQVINYPPYIGMLSNWGVLLWMATAVICIFSAILLKKHLADVLTVRFIGVSGILSLFLAVDDLFLFHDRVLPRMLHLPERIFYILYILALLSYLAYFFQKIMQYDYLLIGSALFLFGISRRMFIAIPFFDQFRTTGDILKYFGIVFWLVFFYRTSAREITGLIHPKETGS